MKMKMMMRVGAILSRNIRRRKGGVLTKLPTTNYHDFPSFFCTSSFDATNSNPSIFISQVEQPSLVKCPLDKLDELPSSDGEYSSSDGEYSSSDGEHSSSKGGFWGSFYPVRGFTCSDGKYLSYSHGEGEALYYDTEWCLEKILIEPKTFFSTFKGQVLPLAQVFSVSLHTDFDDDRPCDIYGKIRATNAQCVDSDLYKRSHTNSEVIPNGGILSLKGGFSNFITYGPTTNTTIDLKLKDKSRNTVVIKQKHNLHSFNQDFEHSSNKLIKDIVHGEGCFAVIYYAKFLFAVRAIIRVAIFCKRDPTSPFVDVYGNIAMEYGNARKYCNNDSEVRHMKGTLFSKTFDHPQRVRVGENMKLSRYVVAMPAYSSLVIDADISDSHGRLAAGSLEIPFSGPHQNLIDGEFGTIAVTVLFNTPCSEFIPEVDITEKDVRETDFDGQVELSSVIDDRKKNPVPSLQQQIMTSTPLRGMRSFSSMQNDEVVYSEPFCGDVLTELFSIYVGGTNHEVSAVCGSIRINDCPFISDWFIFGRGLDNPMYFSEKGFIPIEKHSVISTNYSCRICLSFTDPLNGKELCCSGGEIWFEEVTLMKWPDDVAPLNKRICSYIQGAHGYVLLHYIIFENACQAKVEITLFSNQNYSLSLPVRLRGLVVATYNNHTYATAYEKKYCRSRLFYKPQPEFVELDSDMIVPLSKSAIAVPKGVGLVVEVDMEVLSPGNQKDIVFGKKVFNINMSRTTHKEILGNCYGVQISTKFNYCVCTVSKK